MASAVTQFEVTRRGAALNPCQVRLHVYIRKGKEGQWREAREGEHIVPGHEIEVFAECDCRALIDIQPDPWTTPKGISWSEMVFIPDGKTRTRKKIAYYKPRRVSRKTEVKFKAMARCRCRDCVNGSDTDEFALVFEGVRI